MGHFSEFNARTQSKRGFPCLKQENRGEGAVPHLLPLMVQLQVIPPPPLPCGFLLFLLFPLLPERTYSHTVTRMNLGPFCCDFVRFHRKDTKQLCGTGGGEVGRVRGSPSQRDPHPHLCPRPLQSSTTDKLWQMGSGECFLHTHVITAITLVLLSSPHSDSCVSWEESYQCEEVPDGNANLIWGACTLLFIVCLHDKGFAAVSGAGIFCNI